MSVEEVITAAIGVAVREVESVVVLLEAYSGDARFAFALGTSYGGPQVSLKYVIVVCVSVLEVVVVVVAAVVVAVVAVEVVPIDVFKGDARFAFALRAPNRRPEVRL